MPSAVDLPSQASTPAVHLCSEFLLPGPPQCLYQAPPGAQQLTRPDFLNVPHFRHVIVLAIFGLVDGVVIVVMVMTSRSMIGRRGTCPRVLCMVLNVGADVSSVGTSMIGRRDTCPRVLCMVPGFGADVPSVGADVPTY